MSAQGLELLQVQPKHRISPRVRAALRFMVDEGLNRADAAQKAGLTDNALYIAMRKPDVLAYRSDLMQVLRSSEASRTIARAAKLADSAESEHVKLQANTWIAAIEGISPIAKSENLNINKNMQPGMTLNIIVGSAPVDDALLIGSQPHQGDNAKVINALPRPVPHPSMRNAPQIEASPGVSKAPAKRPRGVK